MGNLVTLTKEVWLGQKKVDSVFKILLDTFYI